MVALMNFGERECPLPSQTTEGGHDFAVDNPDAMSEIRTLPAA
jgi:hypothetical protein